MVHLLHSLFQYPLMVWQSFNDSFQGLTSSSLETGHGLFLADCRLSLSIKRRFNEQPKNHPFGIVKEG